MSFLNSNGLYANPTIRRVHGDHVALLAAIGSCDDLNEIADALRDINSLQVEDDAVRVTDPNGYAMAFEVTRTRKLAAAWCAAFP